MSGNVMAAPPYFGARLTLTAQNTNYNLLALIKAIAAYADIPNHANLVILRAGSAAIQVGGTDLSANNEGDSIPANNSKAYGPFHTSCFPIGSLNLRCNSGASATVNVEVISVEMS